MGLSRAMKQTAPAPLKRAARPAMRLHGRATAHRRQLPDFLVIGTKRGGTQSFFQYLLQHPHVLPMWPAVENAKKTNYFTDHYERGEAWYRGHFPSTASRRRREGRLSGPVVTGEACQYYMFHPLAAERAARLLPGVQIIVLLRNPVDRAWSHYNERRKHGAEPLTFLEALQREPERLRGEQERLAADPSYRSTSYDWHSYLARGRYREQLERWYAHYPVDQVHVVRSEDLFREPQAVLGDAMRFLGLPHHTFVPHHFNRSLNYRPVPTDARDFLVDRLAAEVEILEDYLGRPFRWNL